MKIFAKFILAIAFFYHLVNAGYFEENEKVEVEVNDGPNVSLCRKSNQTDDNCTKHAPFGTLPWPNGIIPYKISQDFTTRDQDLILAMIDKIQDVSCIQFKQVTSEATFVHIQRRSDNGPCESFVGFKNTGPRDLFLQEDCMTRNGILHELMHALGFRHEHLRYDRDTYLTIEMSNVIADKQKMFQKRNIFEHILVCIGYDVRSIMHYPYNVFAKDKSFPTMIAKSGEKIQANGLSKKDIMKINRLYDCNRTAEIKQCEPFSHSTTEKAIVHKLNKRPRKCPYSWTYVAEYPHICYKFLETVLKPWDIAKIECSETLKGASLPIFRDVSEYIAYTRWWIKNQQTLSCASFVWLGTVFNATTKNTSWVDGSSLTFAMPTISEGVNGLHHKHFATGSHWILTPGNAISICQFRLEKDPSTVSLHYPRNLMCPDNFNWFYDAESDICYFFNWHTMNWLSAHRYCQYHFSATLPQFNTVNEQSMHIACGVSIWLGYYKQNGVHRTENGSQPLYFPLHSSRASYDYVYFTPNSVWTTTTVATSLNFLCQCRSDNCLTENE